MKLEIPDSFYEEEERCGYVVSAHMKKVWAVELDLLYQLQQVCEKYGIQYYGSGGTILGAERHKGMIPWDDDIDIMMLRDQYDLLCSHADEFEEPYFFQTFDTDEGYFRGHAQLRNSNTTGVLVDEAKKNVPYVASEGAAALIAEEGSYGDTDDAFGQVVFHAYKFGRICKASDELIQDAVFDIMGYLAKSHGKSIGKCQAGYYWTGTGSNQPQGVLTAAGTGVTAAATNAITADEVIDLFYSLPEEYRDNAAFVIHNTTVKLLRKLKTSGSGEYIWAPGFNGTPDTILGKPMHTSVNIPEVAANKAVIAFGDFEACYKIADRQGFNFKVLDQLYAATGQIGFRGDQRSDGKGIYASTGIKVLKTKAS